MEHRYLLTLRGTDGKSPAALLRLKRGKAGYQAERRDYAPLPKEAAVWLLTPAGPVPMGDAKPGPLLGAALVEGERCLAAGAVKGAKIDLPGELLRLRLRLQAEKRAGSGDFREKKVEAVPQPLPEPPSVFGAIEEAAEEGIEEATKESIPEPVQTEPAEAPGVSIAEAEEPLTAEPINEATDSRKEAPAVAVMAILPEPEEDMEDACGCNADIESELTFDSLSEERKEYREEWTAGMQIADRVPEGADEISGREYGWNAAEEEERRAIWVTGGFDAETDVEYNAIQEMEGMEYADSGEGRSEALQDILARAERAFSDHVPPSPSPVLAEGVEVIAGPAADPVEAREGLSMAIPNPFPNTFPGAAFRRVHRPQGQGWYLQGEMRRGNERWRITAMPGEYRPIPPCALQGFHRYIKSRDGGYWVRIERG